MGPARPLVLHPSAAELGPQPPAPTVRWAARVGAPMPRGDHRRRPRPWVDDDGDDPVDHDRGRIRGVDPEHESIGQRDGVGHELRPGVVAVLLVDGDQRPFDRVERRGDDRRISGGLDAEGEIDRGAPPGLGPSCDADTHTPTVPPAGPPVLGRLMPGWAGPSCPEMRPWRPGRFWERSLRCWRLLGCRERGRVRSGAAVPEDGGAGAGQVGPRFRRRRRPR